MAHLSFFGIDNFRVFKDLHRFEFKPITVLVGTNSSGKSSLSKGILLLKDAFEKVKSDGNIDGFDGEDFIVSGASINESYRLDFNQNLNLGNFEKVLNHNSAKDMMLFEYPIKIPALKDQFIIRIQYGKDNTKLKHGIQKDIEIIHFNSNTRVFHYDDSQKALKINFSFLYEKLITAHESYNKIIQIAEQIKILLADYIQPNEVIEIALNNLNDYDIPHEKKEQINYLKGQIRKLENDVFTEDNFNYINDINSFKAEERIYGLGFWNMLKSNFQTLLNYSFLYDENYLKNYCSVNNINYNELLVKNNIILNNLEKKSNKKNAAYLIRLELEALNELKIIGDIFISDVLGLAQTFMSTFQELAYISNAGWIMQFKETLIKKDSIYEDIFNENLILNSKNKLQSGINLFIRDFIYNGINKAFSTLGDINRSIHYIPSVRTKIDRIYRNSLDSYFQEILFDFHQIKLNEESDKFIHKYIKLLQIADEFEIHLAEDSSFTKIFLKKNGIKQELADVGYGLAQILPIILKIGILITSSTPNPYFSDTFHASSIVIVEEPETNLHPALQSKLADMFVECYQKYNIQFIVETHSEYLIRKLQYLTAKGEFSAKDSNIYYFNDPNNIPAGEPQVKKIEILEDGSLSDDFGSGFFDEAANWELELLRLKKNKIRQN